MPRDISGPDSSLRDTGTRESSSLQGFTCWWKASEKCFRSTVGSKPLFESQMACQGGLTLGSFCLDGNPSLDKNLDLLGAASPCFGQIATWFLAPGTLPLSVCPQISLSLACISPCPAQAPCNHALLFPRMQPPGAGWHPMRLSI